MTDKDDLPSLEALDKSIAEAKKRAGGDLEKNKSGGMRVCADIISGVAVGVFVGFWLDKWFDTRPMFLILCFCLGVAGSALNIYRFAVTDNDKEDS